MIRSGVVQSGKADYNMIYAVRKVNPLRLKRIGPKTIDYRALRNYCKEDFLKDVQLIEWVSTLDPKSDYPSEGDGLYISRNL